MPGGTRGFELLIPFVIGGLILHGFMWLLAIILPFSYVGLFSDNGLLVWIAGGYFGVFLYLIATDGLRETIMPLIKWSVVVAIIYGVVGLVTWYFNTYQDSPLVQWLVNTAITLGTNFQDLPTVAKMAIAVIGFIAFFTLLPMSCYFVWNGFKAVFEKLVRPAGPKPPGRASF